MCVFCDIVAHRVRAYVVAEDRDVVAFLDHRPLFPGHCLIVPRPHYETLPDLPVHLLEPLFGAARRAAGAMVAALGAQGSFVAVNNKVSQSVPHLHVHVVPRTRGDGLRGFFWPRRGYRSEAEMAETMAALQQAMAVDEDVS